MSFTPQSFFNNSFLFTIIFFLFGQNLYSQDNHKTFMTIPLEYELPLSRNGLSVTAFLVTPSISIVRWETKAQIILNIKKVQSTLANADPSYTQSYNYNGIRYGNQHVGEAPFNNIRADNSSVQFEVLVTFRDKSWGWVKVDGLGNQFGPIPKNAKASEVNVRVRIVGIGFFSGTSNIENKIRALLNNSGGENDIVENSNDGNETTNETNPRKPKVNSKPVAVAKKKTKRKVQECTPGGNIALDAKGVYPENTYVDDKNPQNYDKMSTTSQNLSLKRDPIKTSSNKKINIKKPAPQKTIEEDDTVQNTDSSLKSMLTFNGRTFNGEGECLEGSTLTFTSENQDYLLIILNLPTGSASVNSNYYTNACMSCVAVQFQDIGQSRTYVATRGSISRNGNTISINVSVCDLLELIEGNGTQLQISSQISCEN